MIRLFGRTLSGRVMVAGVGRVDRLRRRRRPGAGAPPGIGSGHPRPGLRRPARGLHGDIARLRPDIVLVADAVDMRAAAGQHRAARVSRLPAPASIDGHGGTLRTAMEYLAMRTRADGRCCSRSSRRAWRTGSG